MKLKAAIVALLMAAGIATAAPAPYPMTVNSRSATAPDALAFAGNECAYRVTFKDGGTASDVTGLTAFMSWATNRTASVYATSTVSIVDGSNGVVDFTFSADSLNYAGGTYIYEIGINDSGTPKMYRQGTFKLSGSPRGTGTGTNWTYAINWNLYEYSNTAADGPVRFAGTGVTVTTNADGSVTGTITETGDISAVTVTNPITGGGTSGAVGIGFDGTASFVASGATALNGTAISSGTVADARIASTIARDSEIPTFAAGSNVSIVTNGTEYTISSTGGGGTSGVVVAGTNIDVTTNGTAYTVAAGSALATDAEVTAATGTVYDAGTAYADSLAPNYDAAGTAAAAVTVHNTNASAHSTEFAAKTSTTVHNAHTNLSLAGGAHGGELDPVWGAVSNTVTTGAALGATSTQPADLAGHTNLTLALGAHGGELDPIWAAVSNTVFLKDGTRDMTGTLDTDGNLIYMQGGAIHLGTADDPAGPPAPAGQTLVITGAADRITIQTGPDAADFNWLMDYSDGIMAFERGNGTRYWDVTASGLQLGGSAARVSTIATTVTSNDTSLATGGAIARHVAGLTSDLRDDSMADALHRHSELSASDGSPNPALWVNASGGVSVGTNATTKTLDLVSAGNTTMRIYGTGANTDPSCQLQNDNRTWRFGLFGSGGATDLFQIRNDSYGVQPFTIADGATGFVGIGTDAPATKLDVNGAATIRGNVTVTSGSTDLTAATVTVATQANSTSNTTAASTAYVMSTAAAEGWGPSTGSMSTVTAGTNIDVTTNGTEYTVNAGSGLATDAEVAAATTEPMWTITTITQTSATQTISEANTAYQYFAPTGNVTLAFSTDFLKTKHCMISLALYSTNSVSADTATISTNDWANISLSTTTTNQLLFMRGYGQSKFGVRQNAIDD